MAKAKNVLIIGLGRFGASVVEDLWNAGVETVVLDHDAGAIDRVKERTSAAFVGDATDLDVLKGIGVDEMDTVVVSFGRFFEAAVLCVASLVQLGVEYIVARAETPRQSAILKTVGAARVIQVEHDMGKRFAKELTTPVTQELLDFAEQYRVLPWEASGKLVGKTLGEARLRDQFGIIVLGCRRRDEYVAEGRKPRLHIPTAGYEIQAGDTLLIVGEEDAVTRFVAEVGE